MTADPAVCFDAWARDGLPDHPTICEGGDRERVYIRAGEARRLLERAYLAGWRQAERLTAEVTR